MTKKLVRSAFVVNLYYYQIIFDRTDRLMGKGVSLFAIALSYYQYKKNKTYYS